MAVLLGQEFWGKISCILTAEAKEYAVCPKGERNYFLLFSQYFKYANEQGNKRDIKGQSEGKKKTRDL